jgi:putative transposase
MPSSFTGLHYHLIFSTKDRAPLISPALRERLYPYIGGILREQRGELVEIGGVADHVHLVARLHAMTAPAEVLRVVKANSSKWVHEELGERQFGWQDGYGAFTVSLSNLATVRRYVRDQENHHQKTTFQEEFVEFLKRHEISYDERYIWR